MAAPLSNPPSGPEHRAAEPLAQASREQIRLGARLFFDARLSANGAVSCATCHIPEQAFSDGRPRAIGLHGALGVRNTPSLLHVAEHAPLFWDGRRDSLASQAADPFVNRLEHGLGSEQKLVDLVLADRTYRASLQHSRDAAAEVAGQIYAALAAFQRTLVAGPSAFERFQYGHDASAMGLSAQRGLRLFTGRAQCSSCHFIGPSSAVLTDNRFHALGIGLGPASQRMPELLRKALADGMRSPRAIGDLLISEPDIAALGRFLVTLEPKDVGAFRTPSLRNVALTAPYMHDGSIATLEDAVTHEVYYRGRQAGQPLILSADEQSDLVTFLRALTGSGLDRLAQDSRRLASDSPAGRAPERPQ